MWFTYSTAKALVPTAVALGNFDGVHCGHRRVIQPALQKVKSRLGKLGEEKCRAGVPPVEATSGTETDITHFPQKSKVKSQDNSLSSDSSTFKIEHLYSTVVTFNPHPREFFSGQSRTLLTPLTEKVQQLSSMGVEQLVLLPFDRELAALSPQEFVEKILVQQLHTQRISVGQDFCFGKQRSGTATDLKAIAASFGIPVDIVPLHTCEGERISSSSIRQALEQGDLQTAKVLLGRPYTLTGSVVQGQQLGRTIGFPTANLQLPREKFLPQKGVYAVRVFIVEGMIPDKKFQPAEEIPASTLLRPISAALGVMNIGNRPTVSGMDQSVEVHLLDWSGDLYGKIVTVQLEKFLRPEQKFASVEDLKAQIAADSAIARSILTSEQSAQLETGD